MTRNCKCGGKLARTDIEAVYSRELRRVVYRDKFPDVAMWRCNGCGVVRSQRKRQAKVS